MKSKIIILLFGLFCCYITGKRDLAAWSTISWDRSGYYLYLPATFIYHDLDNYAFFNPITREYKLNAGIENYGLFDKPTGKKLDKYAIGVALFEAPFFLAAHAYTVWTKNHPPDGYSYPYMLAVVASSIFFVVAGLFVLRKFLLQYYQENVVAITLLALSFGTNLFFYSAYEQGMSHPYSFFLFACLLYLTEKYTTTFKPKYILWTGVVLGLIFIVRPVNIMVGLIPVFWNVNSWESLKIRFQEIRQHILPVLSAALLFTAICFIQFGYWKYATDHWFIFSYASDEGFDFLHPKIWDGLMSYRKGWFIYTPVAFLAFVGFFFLQKQHKTLVPVLLVFFAMFIYVVFSWTQWVYGGSFGCRPLVETLPLAAIPLAAFFSFFYRTKKYFYKLPVALVVVFFISLNIFQSYQYSVNIIHWDRMTEKYYWKVFGKMEVNHDEIDKYLY